MREVRAKHITTGEEVVAFIDDEDGILMDKDGNYLDEWWQYDELSHGMRKFVFVSLLIIHFVMFYLASGG